MKRLLIFLLILCLISCTEYNNIKTIVQIQEKNATPELIKQTCQQVVERLKKAEFENIKLERGISPTLFEVSATVDIKNEYRLAEYHNAFKRSELNLWHKFKMLEEEVDSLRFILAKEMPELMIDESWIGQNLSYDVIFFTHKKYLDSLSSISKKFHSLLKKPKNIRLYRSISPLKRYSKDDYYELHIIDTQSQSNIKITNKHIKEAIGKAGVFPDTYVVSIILDEEGSDIFKKITSEYVGEEIAIAIDDKVHSAPLIYNKIIDGKVEISGSASLKDAETMAALILQPPLPYTLKIIDESITPLQ